MEIPVPVHPIRRVIYILLTMLLTSSIPVQAQDIPARTQAGIGLLGGFPAGELGDNLTNPGIGFSGHVGYRVPQTPVILGVDGAFLRYGRESRAERFSTTIPDVTVRVVTTNNILMANSFLRLQPREPPFRPYIDALFGFHYLFTRTSIRDIPAPFGDDIASSINLSDATLTYGASIGFMIEVYDGRSARAQPDQGRSALAVRRVRTVSIDFRIRYLDGGEASYLKRGDILRQNGQTTLNITQSQTNIVTAFLGAAVEF